MGLQGFQVPQAWGEVPSFHSVSAGVGGGLPSKLPVTMDKPLSVSERLHGPRTFLLVFPLSLQRESWSLFETKEVIEDIRLTYDQHFTMPLLFLTEI